MKKYKALAEELARYARAWQLDVSSQKTPNPPVWEEPPADHWVREIVNSPVYIQIPSMRMYASVEGMKMDPVQVLRHAWFNNDEGPITWYEWQHGTRWYQCFVLMVDQENPVAVWINPR